MKAPFNTATPMDEAPANDRQAKTPQAGIPVVVEATISCRHVGLDLYASPATRTIGWSTKQGAQTSQKIRTRSPNENVKWRKRRKLKPSWNGEIAGERPRETRRLSTPPRLQRMIPMPMIQRVDSSLAKEGGHSRRPVCWVQPRLIAQAQKGIH